MRYSDDEMEEIVSLVLALLDRFTKTERMIFQSAIISAMRIKYQEGPYPPRARVEKEVLRLIRRAEKRKRQRVRPKAVKHP